MTSHIKTNVCANHYMMISLSGSPCGEIDIVQHPNYASIVSDTSPAISLATTFYATKRSKQMRVKEAMNDSTKLDMFVSRNYHSNPGLWPGRRFYTYVHIETCGTSNRAQPVKLAKMMRSNAYIDAEKKENATKVKEFIRVMETFFSNDMSGRARFCTMETLIKSQSCNPPMTLKG